MIPNLRMGLQRSSAGKKQSMQQSIAERISRDETRQVFAEKKAQIAHMMLKVQRQPQLNCKIDQT